MLRIAIKMLMEERTKYIGLLTGVTFTAFLVTFALSYFAGFMTRGFALISENPTTDVWVMDSAVNSTEATINMPDSSLGRVRSVDGVAYAVPLYLGDVTARYANGNFQAFQMIGVDDATLSGAPIPLSSNGIDVLRIPQSVIVDAGGTSDKLKTPKYRQDIWPHDGSHLDVATRDLRSDDELLVDDRRVVVAGVSQTFPRFPPRPLLYTSISEFIRLTPSSNRRTTFIMVSARQGVAPERLAQDIQRQTGLRARTSAAFKKDTVSWFLINSEDVGDMVSMLLLAMLVGFGVTGVMLYMFTYENLRQYALLKALGTSNVMLMKMVFTQALVGVIIGSGIGIGLCAIVGEAISGTVYPFRMMWFSPLLGLSGVLIVSVTAAVISTRPVLRLDPAIVFSSR